VRSRTEHQRPGESTIGQKAELIHWRGPWRRVEQLEFALFESLDWWNHRRLHGDIGMPTLYRADNER
jgi:hypothetical protein